MHRWFTTLQLGRKSRRFAGLVLLLFILQGLLLLIFRPQSVDAAWYQTGWQYRKKLTVNEAQVSGSSNLTNFPALASITDTDVKLRAQSDGDDIMFTSSDGTTKLDHELVSYDSSTGAIAAWVEIPTLDYNDDTTIYMYYGNPSASAQESVAATWANHSGVWHLDEAPANGVTGALNSATNTNDGTPQNFGSSAGTTTDATGKIGGGDHYDGNNDYVGITDAAGLSFNPANNYTWSTWVNRDSMGVDWEAVMTQTLDNDTYVEFYTGDLTGDATWGVVTDGVVFGIQSSAGNYEIAHSNNNVLTNGSWYHVAVVYTAASSAGSKIKIYVNGSDVTATGDTATSGTLASIDPNNTRISENAEFPGENTDGLLDELRMATTNRSSDWLATEYNNQNSPSTFFRVGAQAEIPDNARPVLHWAFDEGNGSSANDSSANSNTGTISGATWQTEDMCSAGKCLRFDGSNDYVRKTYSSDADLDPGNGSFSVGAWFKHPTSISGTDIIVSRADGINGVGYKLYYDATNGVCFGIDGSAGSFPSDSACTTTSHADNKWHYITGVKSGTSSITLYIDGKQVAQDASLTASTSISGSSSAFYVGLDVDASSNPWDGFLDEVKYYDSERTAAQIRADYAAKGGVLSASTTFGDGYTATLSNGLAGYWKMDESSWASTCSSTPVIDSSGNGNNGNACPNASAATVAAGKFGNAGSFDGTNDYVTFGNSAALYTTTNNQWSMAAWINPTDFAENDTIFRKDGGGSGYFIRCAATSGQFQSLLAHSGGFSQQGGGTCTAGTWQHVAMTYDGKTRKHFINGVMVAEFTEAISLSFETVNAVVAGAGSVADTSENFKGLIDEVRAYNRYLTDSEVAALYDWAPGPVGYWKMDEGTGTTLNDSSGNGLTGYNSASSWDSGKYGTGWKGLTSNWACSGSGSCADNNNFDFAASDNFTIGFWYKTSSATNPASQQHLVAKTPNNTQGYRLRLNTSGKLIFEIESGVDDTFTDTVGSSGADTYDGTWHYATGVKKGTSSIELYIDGVLIESDSSISENGSLANSGALYIGDRTGSDGSDEFDGVIDDIKIYAYARTPKQIISDMNAGHPSVGTPVSSAVGHWSLDEGYGTSANDTSPNSNTLTLSASGWTNSGKFGKAYDGATNRRLTRDDDADFDFSNGSDDFTLSTWFNRGGAISNQEYLVDKHSTNDGYTLYMDSDGDIVCGIGDGAAAFPEETIGGSLSKNYDDTSWHHAVCVKQGTSSLRLYVDGKEITSDTSLAVDADMSNTGKLIIGDANETDGTDEWLGDIDEIKIYRAALSADEVKTEYNQGKSQVLGSISTASDGITPSNEAAREYCVPGDTTSCTGPTGEWKFDETTGATVYDTGSVAGNITLTGSPQWTSGKVGPGLNFDGVNDSGSTNSGSAPASSFLTTSAGTISVWMRPTGSSPSSSQSYNLHNVVGEGGQRIGVTRGTISGNDRIWVYNWDGTEDRVGITYTAGEWVHITLVHSGGNLYAYKNGVLQGSTASGATTLLTAEMRFGEMPPSTNQYYTGDIDHVRIYNYARTAAQIAWDYNRGGPIGYWQFDECSGTTAYDASGNGYNGTISIGGSGTYTSAGTCGSGTAAHAWNAGSTGKFNAALGFDDEDDYVSVANNTALGITGDIAISAWVKRNNTGYSPIASKANGPTTATRWDYDMYFNASNLFCFYSDNTTPTSVCTSATVTDTTSWHHVAVSRIGSTITFYIDGKSVGSGTMSGSFANNADPFLIGNDGSDSGFVADALIDDVRLYNYGLTATQIRNIFNQGSAIRFGPSTGTP